MTVTYSAGVCCTTRDTVIFSRRGCAAGFPARSTKDSGTVVKHVTNCRVVNAARLAVAAPWVVLLLLGTQSATLQAYDTPGGTLLLVIGAVVCAVAYRAMLHIGRLPEERRVLR